MKIRELQVGATVTLTESENAQPIQVKVTYAYFNRFVSYERIGFPEESMFGSMLYGRFLKNSQVA